MGEVGSSQSATTGGSVSHASGWSGGGDNNAGATFDSALAEAGAGQFADTGTPQEQGGAEPVSPATPGPDWSNPAGIGDLAPDESAAKAAALTPFDLAREAFERALGLMGRGIAGVSGAGLMIEALRPSPGLPADEVQQLRQYEREIMAARDRETRAALAETDPFREARLPVAEASALHIAAAPPAIAAPAQAPRSGLAPEGPAVLADPIPPVAPPVLADPVPSGGLPLPEAVVPPAPSAPLPGLVAPPAPPLPTESFDALPDADAALIAAARPPDPLPALQAIREASVFAERRSAWIYDRGPNATLADRDLDFRSLAPANIRKAASNVTIGDLPDGRRVVLRPSTAGPPTLEIQTSDGRVIEKFRYGTAPAMDVDRR